MLEPSNRIEGMRAESPKETLPDQKLCKGRRKVCITECPKRSLGVPGSNREHTPTKVIKSESMTEIVAFINPSAGKYRRYLKKSAGSTLPQTKD